MMSTQTTRATKHIRFLAYSDIHHHEYQNGLTGGDVSNVEDQITDLCVQHKVDFWIFGGDRFISRNPLDITKRRADQAIKKRNDLGIPGYMMVGNHDQYTKNPYSDHTMGYIRDYPKDLPNICVMDARNRYAVPVRRLSEIIYVCIHAVPAGHSIEESPFEFSPYADFNICLFHGIVRGSAYQNGTIAQDGLRASLFDDERFHMVLGGDNHKRQALKGLSHTMGLYIGAPMQHNWGDVDDDRGCLLIDLEKDENGHIIRDIKVCPLRYPKFVLTETRIESDKDMIDQIGENINEWHGNIIRWNISGVGKVLDGIKVSDWEAMVRTKAAARGVKIKLEYDQSEYIQTPIPVVSQTDEWRQFLAAKGGDIKDLDLQELERVGLEYITGVKDT